jgi:spore coat protein A, manganese oxidase
MNHISRRCFLRYGTGAGAALMLPWTRTSTVSAAAGLHLTKFVEPLPRPGAGLVVATPSALNAYSFTQVPIARRLHPMLPPTPIWAYDDGSGLSGQAGSFGMVVVAESGTPLRIDFTNGLPGTYPAWIPVDTRLTRFGHNVRVLTHLHGGFVAGASDGNPAVTPDGFGPGETQTVFYPNQPPQTPATLLWFHDHGPGTTRLNVFAGLAAAYIVRDQYDTGREPNPIGIPGGAYELPLVIQDRAFNSNGTFHYATSEIEGVTWIGEYFGDAMLVNGKVWPFVDVEPRLYRFRILNGCNARILNLSGGGLRFWQIGGDGGMWDRPVRLRRLVLAPAERADVLVDFSGLAGNTIVLRNGRPPAPVATPAPPLTAVMQIRVGTTVSRPGPTAIPTTLPGRAADLRDPIRTRYITLNEVAPESAAWRLTVNGAPFGFAAETPRAGTIEDWVYINLTEDTHPMHPHLVTHQVIGRTPFDAEAYQERFHGPDGVPGGIDPTPFAVGEREPAEPEERGFKDTVKANPGYFTTIRAKFELPDGVTAPQAYVHHCHIIEHEDNDMMQPFTIAP